MQWLTAGEILWDACWSAGAEFAAADADALPDDVQRHHRAQSVHRPAGRRSEYVHQLMPAVCACVLAAVDEMGGRIDDLEKSIGELMSQAGIEEEAEKASAKPAAAPAAAPAPAVE